MMGKYALSMLLMATVALNATAGTPSVEEGQSPLQVKRVLGDPIGTMESAKKTIWLYGNGTVEFQDGKVVGVFLRDKTEPRKEAKAPEAQDKKRGYSKAETLAKLKWPSFRRDYLTANGAVFQCRLQIQVNGEVGYGAPEMLVRVVCAEGWGHDYVITPWQGIGRGNWHMPTRYMGDFVPAGKIHIYAAVVGHPETQTKMEFDLPKGYQKSVSLQYPKDLEEKHSIHKDFPKNPPWTMQGRRQRGR
jgi:hypothetical protein